MFIDQFITVNNIEVKHFKCAPITAITDLLRPLQTPPISNSLIAKEILLLCKLKCIFKNGAPVLSQKTTQNKSAHVYVPHSGRILKPRFLCVTTFASFLLLC